MPKKKKKKERIEILKKQEKSFNSEGRTQALKRERQREKERKKDTEKMISVST